MTIKDLDNHLITLTQGNIRDEEFNALMQHTSKILNYKLNLLDTIIV